MVRLRATLYTTYPEVLELYTDAYLHAVLHTPDPKINTHRALTFVEVHSIPLWCLRSPKLYPCGPPSTSLRTPVRSPQVVFRSLRSRCPDLKPAPEVQSDSRRLATSCSLARSFSQKLQWTAGLVLSHCTSGAVTPAKRWPDQASSPLARRRRDTDFATLWPCIWTLQGTLPLNTAPSALHLPRTLRLWYTSSRRTMCPSSCVRPSDLLLCWATAPRPVLP